MAANTFSFSQQYLESVAAKVLDLAREAGATACEVDVSEGVGQSVSVRLDEIETIEYNQDKSVGLTFYVGQRKAQASTSDFSDASLRETVKAVADLARYTAEDPAAGLVDRDRLATTFTDLDLDHPWDLDVEAAIALALRCEGAARAVDPRISNSEGATVSVQGSQFVYGSSDGFLKGYASTRHSLSAAVLAGEGDDMQRDYWYSVARHPEDLEDAVSVGRRAGERTLRRLGGRQIPTGVYPVLFEAPVAASLIGHLVSAITGGNLYRKSSFLLDAAGTRVMSPVVDIREDPFVPRGLASGMFDSEGVQTAARTLVEGGVLQGYMLGSYSARKLGLSSTGNAGGPHNLLVRDTGDSFDALVAKMGRGLIVTELMGHGVNNVTGDYSRGAAGFWVENGVIAYPVHEITIAGNLKDMYRDIVAIGSDSLVRGATRTGSILLEKMTVAGAD